MKTAQLVFQCLMLGFVPTATILRSFLYLRYGDAIVTGRRKEQKRSG